jgi:hypothetical protein
MEKSMDVNMDRIAIAIENEMKIEGSVIEDGLNQPAFYAAAEKRGVSNDELTAYISQDLNGEGNIPAQRFNEIAAVVEDIQNNPVEQNKLEYREAKTIINDLRETLEPEDTATIVKYAELEASRNGTTVQEEIALAAVNIAPSNLRDPELDRIREELAEAGIDVTERGAEAPGKSWAERMREEFGEDRSTEAQGKS